jgi:acyl-CoA reductase-like NAD-dependent aldehyde dehydrogenase
MATAAQTKIEVQNFIDGERRPSVRGDSEAVLNPATGEQIATAPLSDEKDVDAAVQAAKRAFPGWASGRSRSCASRMRWKSTPTSSAASNR